MCGGVYKECHFSCTTLRAGRDPDASNYVDDFGIKIVKDILLPDKKALSVSIASHRKCNAEVTSEHAFSDRKHNCR